MLRRARSLFLALAFAVPATHAEIFKCVGVGGLPAYQNFPCDSDGPVRTASARATKDESMPSVPRIGMSSVEVRRIWGEPINSTTEEFAKADIETWTYPGERSVRFDRKGRVIAIHP